MGRCEYAINWSGDDEETLLRNHRDSTRLAPLQRCMKHEILTKEYHSFVSTTAVTREEQK